MNLLLARVHVTSVDQESIKRKEPMEHILMSATVARLVQLENIVLDAAAVLQALVLIVMRVNISQHRELLIRSACLYQRVMLESTDRAMALIMRALANRAQAESLNLKLRMDII
jgi:hypothetical protein